MSSRFPIPPRNARTNQQTASRRMRLRRSLPLGFESLEPRQLMASDVFGPLPPPTEYFIDAQGDDWNQGSLTSPFKTLRRALDAAQPGDTITLRNGVYEGGINIDVDHLTIRSMPGEWAVIESPLTELTDGRSNSVIRYDFGVQGGRLENIEVKGGYWYGIMFWDWWDSDFSPTSIHTGPSGITLDGVKVHNTGVDAIKITPGADDITILNSEISNTGRRLATSADGIDNNNGDRMIARNNYLHDIAGVGILTSGGTIDSLIEQNFIQQTQGAGIVAGYYTELEWIDPLQNPNHFAAINPRVQNNIIVDAAQAGIGIYGAKNPFISHNTIVNAASQAQAPIQIGGYQMWVSNSAPSYELITSEDISIVNNIITNRSDNLSRMIDIRESSYRGNLTIDFNLYHSTSTRGTLFINRNSTGDGTPEQSLSHWQSLYQLDLNSFIADPKLTSDWHLSPDSPAIDAASPLNDLILDFDNQPRAADPPQPDVDPPEPDADPPEPDLGADEFQIGSTRQTPPQSFGAPSLEFSTRAYHAFEGEQLELIVHRFGSLTDTVSVNYAFASDSASSSDFEATPGTLVFAPGEQTKSISTRFLKDASPEGDEHFSVALSNPLTNGSLPIRLGHQSVASITIDDLDTQPTLHYATKWVAPDGSDTSGDGSESAPWKSLQHAADHVSPGDFVFVKPGKYWGMNLTTDGKPDARITFYALPGVEIDEPHPGQQDGINLEAADHITIEGFYVHDMPRAGLRSVNNEGVVLRNNRSDHNTMWGILTGWSENILIENNHVSNSLVEHGIYVSNSADHAIVRNNRVWGNHDSGIQFNADGSLPGDGVHSFNIIENNIVYDNSHGGGAALNLDGVQDSKIQNNLLFNNHATGIVLYQGFAADASKRNLVANNTVLMADDARWALLMNNGSSDNIIVNNILLNQNPNRGSFTIDHSSLPAYSNFNLIHSLVQLGGYNTNYAAWQSFTNNMDSQSLVLTQNQIPATISQLFIDPTNLNFDLNPNSIAVNAGTVIPSELPALPSSDLHSRPRIAGAAIDLGALEYQQLPSPIDVSFAWRNYIGYESTGVVEITLLRQGDTSNALEAIVFASPGTASTNDFQPFYKSIVFSPGESSKSVYLLLNDDTLIENLETIDLSLQTISSIDHATLHVASDDKWNPGTIQFNAASVTVDEHAGVASISVQRLKGLDGDVTIQYQSAPYAKPKQPTWIQRHTELLYPVDNADPASLDSDFQSVQVTLHFAPGEQSKIIQIPIHDDRWFEPTEAFLLRLNKPTNGATLGSNDTLKVRIANNDVKQPGKFEFTSSQISVTEGTPSIQLTIQRIDGANVEASVQLYHSGAGNGISLASAWSPSDYGSLPGSLHFAPGETSKTIQIPIVDDGQSEPIEAFFVQLFSPTNDAVIGSVDKTTISIEDNDSTLAFLYPNGYSQFFALENAGTIPITVTRQGSLSTPASARITSGDWGSASPGIDFTPINVDVQFAPGESSKTISIPIVNDSSVEADETLPVMMSNVTGATQASWTATARIINDDTAANPGTLQLSSANYSVNENGGTLQISVARSGGSDGTVSIQYSTSDGASSISSSQYAWAGSHYGSVTGTLTFNPGEVSKTVNIPIFDNSSVSSNKFFTVKLRNVSGGAQVGTVSQAVVTILEDDSAIEFAQSSYAVSEKDGTLKIRLRRVGSAITAATINLNISSGSATAGVDFIRSTNAPITFAPGEYEKLVDLAIVDDSLVESDESFYFSLSNAVGAKLGSSLWGNAKILSDE